jgi:hypothetical protein
MFQLPAPNHTFHMQTPHLATAVGAVQDGDAVVTFNFRADRMVELSQALEYKDFTKFDRKRWPDFRFAGMMQYDGELHLPKHFLVPPPLIERASEQYVVGTGLHVFACSESQKIGELGVRRCGILACCLLPACPLSLPAYCAAAAVTCCPALPTRQATLPASVPNGNQSVVFSSHAPLPFSSLLQATSPSSGTATAAGTWIRSWRSLRRSHLTRAYRLTRRQP